MSSKVFRFGDMPDNDHYIGDTKCPECRAIAESFKEEYPEVCKCGGLIHAELGDDTPDVFWLYTKCDKCGNACNKVFEPK